MYKTKKKFPYLWAHVFLIFVALGMIIPFIWISPISNDGSSTIICYPTISNG